MKNYKKMVRDVAKKAYTPYSKFNVGCVLVLKNGEVVTGYNIENCAFPAGCCAERVTIFKAHTMNYSKDDIKKVYIYNKNKKFTSPCGICRQVMSELLNLETEVILVNGGLEEKKFTIEQLLPYSFRGESLK